MEENNKLDNGLDTKPDNNTNGAIYGSALYGTEPESRTEETEQSSVYGQGEAQSAGQAPAQGPTPVSLEKPAHTEPQPQTEQPYPPMGSQPINGGSQGFYGQSVNPNPANPNQMNPIQMNGSQTDYNGQPQNPSQMNGSQMDYNGQPQNPSQMNGNQMDYNGQPQNPSQINPAQMNGSQMNYNGQPQNPNQMNPNPMNGNQPNYNGQPIYQNQMNPNQMNSNQMNGYQPNYNGQPLNPSQGPQYAKPKKGKAGLVVGIIAAAAVVLIAAVCVLFTKSFSRSPEKQLAKGMAIMAKEMKAYSGLVSEDIDFDALGKLKKKQPMHTNIDLSFTNPKGSGSIDNLSVEIDAISDAGKEQGKYDISVGTYGFDMEIGSIVADNNILYLNAPLVFKDDVYSIDLTNLGRDFNDSAWADFLETTLPEDSSYTWFRDSDGSSAADAKDALELGKITEKYSKDMAGSIKYAVIREKREFPYGGTLAEYGGVQVTVGKDAYNDAVENMKEDILSSDFYANIIERYQASYGDNYKKELDNVIEQLFGIRFEQDAVLNFYLDKKGRIINISTPEDIAVSSRYADVDSIAVDIDFGGDARALDSVEGGVYIQSGGEILYLGISRTAHITEDFYKEDLTVRIQSNEDDDDITFYYGNDWGYSDKSYDIVISLEASGSTMSLTADGRYEDIVKGEQYTFRVDNAALAIDDENLLLMSGVISVEPAGSGKIEVPQNAVDLLKMSEEEIMTAFYQAAYSLY